MTNPTDTELLEHMQTHRLSLKFGITGAVQQAGWSAIDRNHGTIATAPTPREALLAAFMWANGTKR